MAIQSIKISNYFGASFEQSLRLSDASNGYYPQHTCLLSTDFGEAETIINCIALLGSLHLFKDGELDRAAQDQIVDVSIEWELSEKETITLELHRSFVGDKPVPSRFFNPRNWHVKADNQSKLDLLKIICFLNDPTQSNDSEPPNEHRVKAYTRNDILDLGYRIISTPGPGLSLKFDRERVVKNGRRPKTYTTNTNDIIEWPEFDEAICGLGGIFHIGHRSRQNGAIPSEALAASDFSTALNILSRSFPIWEEHDGEMLRNFVFIRSSWSRIFGGTPLEELEFVKREEGGAIVKFARISASTPVSQDHIQTLCLLVFMHIVQPRCSTLILENVGAGLAFRKLGLYREMKTLAARYSTQLIVLDDRSLPADLVLSASDDNRIGLPESITRRTSPTSYLDRDKFGKIIDCKLRGRQFRFRIDRSKIYNDIGWSHQWLKHHYSGGKPNFDAVDEMQDDDDIGWEP